MEKLYMLLLGCKPPGRYIEQHDVFFGVGTSLANLVPDMLAFWPEADGGLHVDAWREVTTVEGYTIQVVPRVDATSLPGRPKLYFVNLGGYKPNDFEEYHYKCLAVATDLAGAIRQAKSPMFFRHHASAHIDDQYGVDVDDIYEIEEVLPLHAKGKYAMVVEEAPVAREKDAIHTGYLKLSKLLAGGHR